VSFMRVWFHARRAARFVWPGYVDLGESPDDTIVVAGTARSGTTWIGDVVARATNSRIIFEPFLVDRHGGFAMSRPRGFPARLKRNYQLYLPTNSGPLDYHFGQMERILRGQVRSFWSEMQARPGIFRHRVIKEIRANLFLGYLAENWPRTAIVLVLRHPSHVIHSQLAKIREGWRFDWNKTDVLSQEALMRDWLAPFEKTIAQAQGLVERLANKWCIETYVATEELRGRRNSLVVSYAELAGQTASWTKVAQFFATLDWSADACEAAIPVRSYTTARGLPSRDPGMTLDVAAQIAIGRVVEEYGLTELSRSLEYPQRRPDEGPSPS